MKYYILRVNQIYQSKEPDIAIDNIVIEGKPIVIANIIVEDPNFNKLQMEFTFNNIEECQNAINNGYIIKED